MNKSKTHYVLGFMFNKDKSKVALIKKNRPDWQRGKLNGIGGKIFSGGKDGYETAEQAMYREFKEETGYPIFPMAWKFYAKMFNDDFQVDVFAAIGDLSILETMTDEKVVILKVKDITKSRKKLISNLPWLIEMAIDFLNNGEFDMATVRY